VELYLSAGLAEIRIRLAPKPIDQQVHAAVSICAIVRRKTPLPRSSNFADLN
jgi:hypothetical protein